MEPLTELLQKALFIILIGCDDDMKARKARFITAAHECDLHGQLKALEGKPLQELRPLLRLAMDVLESTAKALLNITHDKAGERAPDVDEDTAAKKRRNDLAASRRAKIMAQMKASQEQFASKNAQLLRQVEPKCGGGGGSVGNDTAVEENAVTNLVAIGEHRSRPTR